MAKKSIDTEAKAVGSTGMAIIINKLSMQIDITLYNGVPLRLGAYNKQMLGNVSDPVRKDDIPDAYKKMKGIIVKEVLS